MTWLRALSEAPLARLAQVGADAGDDDEMRSWKALLVFVALLILPIALPWGFLYVALGTPAGVIALLYFAISVAAARAQVSTTWVGP